MMDGPLNDKIIGELGEVKGLLRGVTDMIRHSEQSTHRRIDDLAATVNNRLDHVDERIGEIGAKADAAMNLATDSAARIPRNSAIFGAGTGGLVAAGVEIIKAIIMHR